MIANNLQTRPLDSINAVSSLKKAKELLSLNRKKVIPQEYNELYNEYRNEGEEEEKKQDN
jgi:hypothetical protein